MMVVAMPRNRQLTHQRRKNRALKVFAWATGLTIAGAAGWLYRPSSRKMLPAQPIDEKIITPHSIERNRTPLESERIPVSNAQKSTGTTIPTSFLEAGKKLFPKKNYSMLVTRRIANTVSPAAVYSTLRPGDVVKVVIRGEKVDGGKAELYYVYTANSTLHSPLLKEMFTGGDVTKSEFLTELKKLGSAATIECVYSPVD